MLLAWAAGAALTQSASASAMAHELMVERATGREA
jgi:hypothetical protein